ncbi:hypothetical protein B5X24_HaOG205652 [Helicoverpa armigera]|uniref:Uncharacterized protein n=1 Tax=Helicoverpa armigera TaxID=29058 RepID=A0A2W1BT26_HELAM|nr:hypothetical protein B5X24_HaOG205652 [Helicoverpa armigera]
MSPHLFCSQRLLSRTQNQQNRRDCKNQMRGKVDTAKETSGAGATGKVQVLVFYQNNLPLNFVALLYIRCVKADAAKCQYFTWSVCLSSQPTSREFLVLAHRIVLNI